MPEDRLLVFRAFKKVHHNYVMRGGNPSDISAEGISLREAARAIGCSTSKAESVLDELVALGVIRKGRGDDVATTREQAYYRIT